MYQAFANPVMENRMEANMKRWKKIFLVMLVILTVLSLLLSACGPLDNTDAKSNNGKGQDKQDKNDDKGQAKEKGGNADKITICHRTGSAKNPYVEIRIADAATKDGHGGHPGDLIPAPEGGCPDTAIADVPEN
jgi:predicted small lipoprotein YifL